MTKIEAIVQPGKFENIKSALIEIGPERIVDAEQGRSVDSKSSRDLPIDLALEMHLHSPAENSRCSKARCERKKTPQTPSAGIWSVWSIGWTKTANADASKRAPTFKCACDLCRVVKVDAQNY